MELYVGGRAQGKLAYVQQKKGESLVVAEGSTATREELCKADIIHGLQDVVRRCNQEGEDSYQYIYEVIQANPKVAIVCDEVGAGIVPMERSDRDYRELVGRVCCELAKQADTVERIVCGIGVKLK